MSPITAGILGSALLVFLLFLGMPIAFVMMFVGFLGISYLASVNAALPVVAKTLYETAAYYPYTIIPLFILMGGFAGSAGITRELYETFDKWFRKLPGGLGIATIAACAFFAALSGSSVAASAAMGTIAIPEMRRFHYAPKLAVGVVAAGGTLSFLIPPSLGFVVYGMLTEQSIGKLLISGILPGIILSLAFTVIVVFQVKLNPSLAPATSGEVSWKEKLLAFSGIWETLLVFFIVMGGIYLGFINPTEAGAIGATALFVIVLLKRKLTLKNLSLSLLEAARISVLVLFLVAGANVFSYFLALSTIPTAVSSWMAGLLVSRYVILSIIVIIYLILGCFLDAISMMVLTMPVIFPVIKALGFDPIWFGVICVIMMEAGLITPPVGLNIYTLAGVAKDVPMEEIFRGAVPFLLSMIAIVILITIFPKICLFLPSMMGR
ncbi:MAG: C4-dicarboxylate ABC transporter permease [Deltaproteobacteria bacterium CG_4_8_14_3_um_filter_45_9]|nr:MAG: C4-dicarboxylate ABC transporter permease [Deltaproteobacteria bacterium CG_4_8_14_3_um_filter_45_9]